MRTMTIILSSLLLLPILMGCSVEEDNDLNPAGGGHSIKLVNQFDVSGMDRSGKLSLELDGKIVIADVPLGMSKTYSGISSGRHYYRIIYKGPAYATWEQGYHDFIGRDTTLVVIVKSDGTVSGYVEA